jgi:chorismate dehydratase
VRPRVGCVPYLNARPLADYLELPEVADRVELVYDTPARLAAALRLGDLQVAMVSSYELLTRPGLQLVPGASISSRGKVRSVRLFSKVPFERIESLALDSGSLTSTHLAQVLLSELYDCRPILSSEPPDPAAMLARNDACVLIGDIGMSAPSEGLHVMDLGEAWAELTGAPFVWAAWIGEAPIAPELCALLLEARHWGVRRLRQLAEKHARRLGWDPAVCSSYLIDTMEFDLTPAHTQALELFQTLCITHGLLQSRHPLTVAPAPQLA